MPKIKGKPQKVGILHFFTKTEKTEPSQSPVAYEAASVTSLTGFTQRNRDERPFATERATAVSVDKHAPAEHILVKRQKRKLEDDDNFDEYDLERSHATLFEEFGDHSLSTDNPERCEETQTSDTNDHHHSDEEHVTVYPFEPLETYVCPFKILGQCKRSETFRDMKACANHVHRTQPNCVIKTIEEDPIEDGTPKVTCPRNCGQMFAQYGPASYHARKTCKVPAESLYPQSCPWNKFGVLCVEMSISARAAATHAGAHVRDPRGPYQCHLCGQYWGDMYLLQSHIMRCKGTGRAGYSKSCHRIELEVTTKQPTTIMIARSSDGTPKAWFQGCEYVEEGLPKWAADKLADHKSDFGLTGWQLPTFFHAGAAVQSRSLPASKENIATSTTSSARQTQLARSWEFTNGIVKDLNKIASALPSGKPTLVSIGIDGFACQISLILPFLKRVPQITWVIRETELCYGMSEKVFPRRQSGLYYGVFDSYDMIAGIEARLSTDKAKDDCHDVDDEVQHLLNVWDTLQNLKDKCRDLKVGRNIGRNGDHRKDTRPDMKESKLIDFLSGS
jgi:hypothetical protein